MIRVPRFGGVLSPTDAKESRMWPFDLLTTWTPDGAWKRLQNARAPSRMRVTGRLNLANAGWLTYLPQKLETEAIDVSGCARMTELPEKLKCADLALQRTLVKS